jgi:hypothetical protein
VSVDKEPFVRNVNLHINLLYYIITNFDFVRRSL